MAYHERLGLPRERFEAVLEHFESRTYRDLDYRSLPDYRTDIDRGTVLIEGEVVHGFPKVPRTLVLQTGIPRFFTRHGGDHEDETGQDRGDDLGSDPGRIVVEEKLDGYNVRIAKVVDRILAFTRSGVICPFTRHHVQRLLPLEEFFEAHPDLVICGEMIGPENPYTVHDYPGIDSIAFRAFDVRRRSDGDPLPVAERRDLCAAFDVPQVERYGAVPVEEAPALVAEIIDRQTAADREGVVMKSADGERQLKYTTGAANRGDLAYAFSLPFEYGRSFMFRRLLREGFQAVEWDEEGEALERRAAALGEAILLPMVDTIRSIDSGGTVGEEHVARAPPGVIDELFEHFRSMGIHVDVLSDRRDGTDRVVQFRKKTQATNQKTRNYLDGHIVHE